MKDKDMKNLENIVFDIEDCENGCMISLSQEELNSLKSILEKQKVINQLLEDMKERANNFSYESEIMWRKIEKAEKLLKEN